MGQLIPQNLDSIDGAAGEPFFPLEVMRLVQNMVARIVWEYCKNEPIAPYEYKSLARGFNRSVPRIIQETCPHIALDATSPDAPLAFDTRTASAFMNSVCCLLDACFEHEASSENIASSYNPHAVLAERAEFATNILDTHFLEKRIFSRHAYGRRGTFGFAYARPDRLGVQLSDGTLAFVDLLGRICLRTTWNIAYLHPSNHFYLLPNGKILLFPSEDSAYEHELQTYDIFDTNGIPSWLFELQPYQNMFDVEHTDFSEKRAATSRLWLDPDGEMLLWQMVPHAENRLRRVSTNNRRRPTRSNTRVH